MWILIRSRVEIYISNRVPGHGCCSTDLTSSSKVFAPPHVSPFTHPTSTQGRPGGRRDPQDPSLSQQGRPPGRVSLLRVRFPHSWLEGHRADGSKLRSRISTALTACHVAPEAWDMEASGLRGCRGPSARASAKAAASRSTGCSAEGTAANGTRWSEPGLRARASRALTQ